jgi:hypothetical protein
LWIIFQNYVWTADRQDGLILDFAFAGVEIRQIITIVRTVRIWSMIRDWLGLMDFDPSSWAAFNDVEA